MTSLPVLYDAALRDGAQREGISLTVEDRLKIATWLDSIGVAYIEGGWPGSNPKDMEFFRRAPELRLQNAKLACFGATRKAGGSASSDAQVRELLDSEAATAPIVGKASALQVEQALRTTRE